MTAPTHLSFAFLCYFVFIAVTQGTMSLWGIGVLSLGALFPDIDTPKSFLGRIFFFISPTIETKLGHRTITHSFIFIGLLYLFCFGLIWVFKIPHSMYLLNIFLIGLLSHVLLDASNKQGPLLFYPLKNPCVFPENKDYRIEVGSSKEWMLFFIIIGFLILSYPLAQRGLIKTLHYLMGDIQSAVLDYQEYSLTNEVFADVSAADNLTNKRIEGRFRVVGFEGKNILILDYDKGKLKTIGDYEDNNLRPLKIKISKGEKLNYMVQQFELQYCQISKLKEYLNDNFDQQIFGTLEPLDKVNIFNDLEYYQAVKMHGGNIVLGHAKYKDLVENNLTNMYVKQAKLLIKTALKSNQVYNPNLKVINNKEEKEKYVNKYDVVITIEDKSEILVKKDDIVERGQVIAHITRNDDKVKIKETERQGYYKELDDIKSDVALYTKKSKLEDLRYQLEFLEKEGSTKKDETQEKIEQLTGEIEVLDKEIEYNTKKFNDLVSFKLKKERDSKNKALAKLQKTKEAKAPDELQLRYYLLSKELNVVKEEVNFLESKKIKDLARVQRNIEKAKLEIKDLFDRSFIKSPIDGLVVSIDFTMSIEYLTRVNITILEKNG